MCDLVETSVRRDAVTPRFARAELMPDRTETMTVNMGPQHPSTHGVLRLVLELDGETVAVRGRRRSAICTPASRKTAEQKKWQQVIPLVERMDYLSAQSNSMAFCLSVERLLGLEMPERVRSIRVLIAELQRHQQPPGLARHARHGSRRRVGDACTASASASCCSTSTRCSPASGCFRATCASAACARICRAGSTTRSRAFLDRFVRRSSTTYEDLLTQERDLHRSGRRASAGSRRTMAVALRPASARSARAAGVELRRAQSVSLSRLRDLRLRQCRPRPSGDVYARYLVRVAEMRESVEICRQALDRIPPTGRATRSTIRGSRRRPRIASNRDGSADSALPDLLAGIHGAGRRGLRAGRRAARRAGLLRSCRTAPTGRGA